MTSTHRSTLYGLIAILLWSTTIAFSRQLSEQIGPLTAGACIHFSAGVLSFILAALRPPGLRGMLAMPRKYLLGCGALFTLYMFCLYLAIGTAADRAGAITAGLINYLWPTLTMVFAVSIFKLKWKWMLPGGILLALGGTVLAATNGDFTSLVSAFTQSNNPWALALAGVAAVCWALYSDLSKKWSGDGNGSAVPLFFLFSSLSLFAVRAFVHEPSNWSMKTGLELAYLATFPGMLAYSLWEVAMRRGSQILVITFSYFSPVLSTLLSMAVLGVKPTLALLAAAALITAGAVICRAAVVEKH